MVLPCNVVVRAEGPDTTLVQALDPEVVAGVSGLTELTEVGTMPSAGCGKRRQAHRVRAWDLADRATL
jgi:hypothetical protein